MKTTILCGFKSIHVAILISVLAGAYPTGLRAQEPMACPTYLLPRFQDPRGIYIEGHWYFTQWDMLLNERNQGRTVADYAPDGSPPSITSTDFQTVWYDPLITVQCSKVRTPIGWNVIMVIVDYSRSFSPASGGGGGDCGYQIQPDPTQTCDSGGGDQAEVAIRADLAEAAELASVPTSIFSPAATTSTWMASTPIPYAVELAHMDQAQIGGVRMSDLCSSHLRRSLESRVRGAAAILATLSALSQVRLSAQTQPANTSSQTPVMVALVDSLPRLDTAYAAVIVRRVGVTPPDIILLPRHNASPELLDAATRVLLNSRATVPAGGSTYRGETFQTLTIGVKGVTMSPSGWMETYRARLRLILSRLSVAKPQPVAEIGIVPALTFYPPPVRNP